MRAGEILLLGAHFAERERGGKKRQQHYSYSPVWGQVKVFSFFCSYWYGEMTLQLPMVINPSFNSGSLKSLHYGVLHTILKNPFCV